MVKTLIVASVALATTACSGFIFEDEGDCDPRYRVRFRYDHNMKFADAFPNEVDHVNLSLVDSDGRIAYTHVESGEALGTDGYEVVLDGKVAPGKYRLHAWCGSGARPGSSSFYVHPAEMIADAKCTLLPDVADRADNVAGAEGTHVTRPLENLYHGYTEEQDFSEDEGTHTFTVPLMKNTNSIKVVLQHLSDEPIDGRDFEFTITSANARMDHDNSLIPSDAVTYHAFDVVNGYASIDHGSATGAVTGTYNATVAEFTIARLMKDENVRLEARRHSDGELVFAVNIVELALMVKGYANRAMSDQEYLDRQDDYNFVFFLDSNMRWIDSFIFVNSWKVVNQNSEIH